MGAPNAFGVLRISLLCSIGSLTLPAVYFFFVCRAPQSNAASSVASEHHPRGPKFLATATAALLPKGLNRRAPRSAGPAKPLVPKL